jgi:hypothetical protein
MRWLCKSSMGCAEGTKKIGYQTWIPIFAMDAGSTTSPVEAVSSAWVAALAIDSGSAAPLVLEGEAKSLQ